MPRGRRTIEVQWPIGGQSERFGFQKQPPYTTHHAANVCLEDTFGNRLRGGSRPGMEKVIATQIGSGNPVNMLETIRTVEVRPSPAQFTEPFSAALDNAWTSGSMGSDSSAVTIAGGTANTTAMTTIAGAWLDLTDGTDFANGVELTKVLTASFKIPCNTKSYAADWDSNYFLFFKMDDSSPDIASAIVVVFQLMSSGSDNYRYLRIWTGTGINDISGGGGTLLDIPEDLDDYTLLHMRDIGTGAKPDFWVRASLEPSGFLRVGIDDQSFLNHDWAHKLGDMTGNAIGFGIQKDDQTAHIDDFTFDYVEKSQIPSAPPIRIVAGSNGEIWREIRSGNTQVMDKAGDGGGGDTSNPNDLALTTEHVACIERFGTLYMADHGVKYTGTGKGVNGAVLTDNAVNFTTAPVVDLNGDYCEITNSSDEDDLANGTYVISAKTATTLTLTGVSCTNRTATYRVVRAMKTYVSGTDLVARHSFSTGSLPVNCRIVALYRDRLCLTGDDDNPTHFYMSRSGDLGDWFASGLVADGGRPVAGVIDSVDVGSLVNRPLTALIPYIDDYLIFAAADTMWILRGDIAMQGFIDVLSRKVGVIHHRAWTTTPEGVLYFLSKEGIYKILPGSQQYPVPVSKGALPTDFLNIDPDLISASLSYDLRRSMIHVYLTSQIEGAIRYHYWLDVRNDALWPMTMQADHEPIAVTLHDALTGDTNRVILGGRDGYIRHYSDKSPTDDGSTFFSTVYFGPFGRTGVETMIHRLHCVLARDSSDVEWLILKGDNPEAALHSASSLTVGALPTWSGGSNAWDTIRFAAGAFYLLVGSENRWALESLIMELEPIAEWRPL